MLTYNTHLKKLVLPEYGRNIQNMVDHCLAIPDRDERTRCAHSIIKTMGTLFPPVGNPEEYRRKLWDHLAIMSDFTLDIDWPYEPIVPESLDTMPVPIEYCDNRIDRRHYGLILENMVRTAADMEPSPEREALVLLLANHMKKMMLAVNPDGVDDSKIFKDLRQMTHGAINLDPEHVRLHEFKAMPAPSKKKKKK